jgi:hypothetical protein
MSPTYTECPKCHFRPPSPLPVDEPCPACGIYVYKWRQPLPVKAGKVEDAGEETASGLAAWLEPLPHATSAVLYGRCFAWLLLAAWSVLLIRYNYRDGEIFCSFMHSILLTIHEAGHVLMRPFGEWLTIFGGSLFQVALPLGIGIAFRVVNRDNFGAALCMWWASVSLLDLAPYIYDALHPQLIMLGGHTGEDGPHDWIYLLGGRIGKAQRLGALVHTVGSLLVVCTLAWAAVVLGRQRKTVEGPEE